MSKLLSAVLFLAASVYSQNLGNVVSEADFIYQDRHREKLSLFLNSYQNNRFNQNEINLIAKTCKKENVSIIWALARMQSEQGIVINLDAWNYQTRLVRCFSYGFGTHGERFIGFENQVTNAIHRMRELADQYRPGAIVPVKDNGNIVCRNLAVYSLHRYNWIWGSAYNWGAYNMGNSLFVKILRDFQSRFERVSK